MNIRQLGFSLIVMVLLTPAASAQNIHFGQWTSVFGNWKVKLISPNSTSSRFGAGDPYNLTSIKNLYGQFGKPWSPDSVNDPYGAGNPFPSISPNTPYGEALSISAE